VSGFLVDFEIIKLTVPRFFLKSIKCEHCFIKIDNWHSLITEFLYLLITLDQKLLISHDRVVYDLLGRSDEFKSHLDGPVSPLKLLRLRPLIQEIIYETLLLATLAIDAPTYEASEVI
jgi:hypothetical protein